MTGNNPKPNQKHDFEVVVKKLNGNFYCSILQLGLLSKGEDLESAYNNLMTKKDVLLDQAMEANIEIEPRYNHEVNQESNFCFKAFLFRSASNLAGSFGVIIVIGMLIVMLLNTSNLNKNIGAMKPGRLIEDAINNSATNVHETSSERKQKLLESIRIVVSRIKPYVDTLRPLFEAPPAERAP